MATVWIPSLLRPLCDNQSKLDVPAETLEALLRGLDAACPGFYDRVVENGRLRPELAVAIDGEAHSYPLHERLRPQADIAIVPSIGGGAAAEHSPPGSPHQRPYNAPRVH